MNKIIKYNGKLNVIGTTVKKIRQEHGWSLTQYFSFANLV